MLKEIANQQWNEKWKTMAWISEYAALIMSVFTCRKITPSFPSKIYFKKRKTTMNCSLSCQHLPVIFYHILLCKIL